MMRAAALVGAYNVTVIDMPVPVLQNSTDAIVRITASAICGSDLHYYHQGLGSPGRPVPIGHEAIGYVESIGDAVQSLQVGDYVVIPDNVDDGHFTFGPDLPHSYGGPDLGGTQAQYVRVPFADDSLIPVPVNATTDDATLMNYLFVSDIFATGWTVLDFAGFQPGDSVAVFGAGPVGLLAAYSALLRGASKVYSVDHVQQRLDLAASIGSIPINFAESDPSEQILALEPNGVTRSVDCVGYEAVNAQGEVELGIVLHNMMNVTSSYGGIGVVGVYLGDEQMSLSMSQFWRKALTMGSGIVLPLHHANELVQLIASGKASPNFIVSSTIGIEQVPEYYRRFDQHLETKVVIRFP
ncbi:putative alcohol dehydrogenase protein [Phaeoacremonium minimum UCRPA7]|uniref:Putative alcohol dehydrogenase protein n=1 Tax=Phaeoacremonium minimum (strain UCR-PA7) TaxID=1286976 RepID=R8B965_PHAM7|nr:putative alcohol dehydrogenase protein [Phaeoacremonium minimum UCRPA7]EON95822.1 putative alcohol dehydrogenase protein [Phaeoacremonium minimum UCRPA7]